MQLVQIATGPEQLGVQASGRVVRRGHTPLAPRPRMPAQIPRLPVVHARACVENDAGVRPRRARKFFEEARRKHRPLAAVRVSHDPDALVIHLRSLRQHVPGVGRRAAEHRQGLHRRLVDGGIIGGVGAVESRLRAADGERHKPAPRQLQREVPMRPRAQTDGRFRLVKHRHRRRPFAPAIGDQQISRGEFHRRPLEPHLDLPEILPSRFPQHLHPWFRDQCRPRPHQLHPVASYFRPPARPVRRRLCPRAVIENQRGTIPAQFAPPLLWRDEDGGRRPPFLCHQPPRHGAHRHGLQERAPAGLILHG